MRVSTVSLSLLLVLVATVPLASAGDLKGDLLDKEKALWTAWGKANGEAFEQGMTEDAVTIVAGVGPTFGRAAIVAEVDSNECQLKSFDFTEVTLRKLGRSVAIISYKATQDLICGETKLPPNVYVSNVYVKKKGKWLGTKYQETPID